MVTTTNSVFQFVSSFSRPKSPPRRWSRRKAFAVATQTQHFKDPHYSTLGAGCTSSDSLSLVRGRIDTVFAFFASSCR